MTVPWSGLDILVVIEFYTAIYLGRLVYPHTRNPFYIHYRSWQDFLFCQILCHTAAPQTPGSLKLHISRRPAVRSNSIHRSHLSATFLAGKPSKPRAFPSAVSHVSIQQKLYSSSSDYLCTVVLLLCKKEYLSHSSARTKSGVVGHARATSASSPARQGLSADAS